jgi:hypothetical protein
LVIVCDYVHSWASSIVTAVGALHPCAALAIFFCPSCRLHKLSSVQRALYFVANVNKLLAVPTIETILVEQKQ